MIDYREKNMKKLCIYHKNCADGFAAAWVVNDFYQGNVDFHAADYKSEPPDVTGRDVIIVDFSYKKPVIEKMIEQCNSLLIIDHHQTAISELAFIPPAKSSMFSYYGAFGEHKAQVLFDTSKSGCMLAWKFFFPNRECPSLLKHIQDRDLWEFKLDGTKEIMSALFSYPYDFKIWNEFMGGNGEVTLYKEGLALIRKQNKDVRNAIDSSVRMMIINGFKVPVANVPKSMASDAGNILCSGMITFAATYFDKRDGREFSLRSDEQGVDVAKIAEIFGGGGHKHASGFTLPYNRLKEFEIDDTDWR